MLTKKAGKEVHANILGIDYALLMLFLWLNAGIDYQLSRTGIVIKTKRNSTDVRIFLIRFAFFVLWFLAVFRGLDVTNDIESYHSFYEKVAVFGPGSVKRVEVGYVILNEVFSKLFTNNEVGFRVLIAVITAVGYGAVEQWIERHAKSYGVCLIAYYYLIDSTFMSATRQMLATGIVLWALMFLEKRNNKKSLLIYILLVLLASTFHQSAIMCAVFPLLARLKFTRNTTIWIILFTTILTGTNAVNKIVNLVGFGTGYLTSDIGNITNVTVISTLYVALLMLQVFMERKKEPNRDNCGKYEYDQDGFYSYAIILALAVTIMSLRAPGMSRMAMYLQIAGLPYISNTIGKIKYPKAQLVIKCVFGLAIWGYSAAALIYRPEWQHLWPYHFFWD